MIKGQKTKNMFLEYETNIKEFKNHVVKIGLPEKVGSKPHTDSGLTIAQVGAVHEYGVPERGISKRSFIREPIINEQKKINKFIKMKFSQVTDNSMTYKMALEQMGSLGESISRKSFVKNDWKALSKATEKRKELNGKSKNNPLVDSGALRRAITFVVERG